MVCLPTTRRLGEVLRLGAVRCGPPPLDLQALTPGPAWPPRLALPSSSFPRNSLASGIPITSSEVPPPHLPSTERKEEKGQGHPSSGAGKESLGFGQGEGCEVLGSGAATAETHSGHHGFGGQLDENIAIGPHQLSSGGWRKRRPAQRLAGSLGRGRATDQGAREPGRGVPGKQV